MKKLYGETPTKNWRWTEEAGNDSGKFAEMTEAQVKDLLEKGYTIPEINIMLHYIIVDTILNFQIGLVK